MLWLGAARLPIMYQVIDYYPGAKYVIRCVRGTKADVDTEIETLSESEQKKAIALIRYVGDNGPPMNEQKCRRIKTQTGIFELKADRVRMPFFYQASRQIVLTHLFVKPGDKEQQSEVKYAAGVRDEIEKSKK